MPNLLIAHGGAPTAVINSSLYGAVMEAKKHPEVGTIYGAIHGSQGILNEQFTNLSALSQEQLDLLLTTPASAIGTSRTPLETEDYDKMADILKKHEIEYVLFNGGNGSMDTCGKLYQACQKKGMKICVVGIPKTIDNDIAGIDHAPGYASAAKFIAKSVSEIAQDVKALPIHVCIIEAMGRSAGWIAAASALARKKEGDAPHLIYTPEVAFDEEAFLRDVKALYEKHGGVVVVVSEELKDKDGKSIVPPIFEVGRAKYYSDVSVYLKELIIKKLNIKARNEKPGILNRCSIEQQSQVDRAEAIQMGEMAAAAAISGKTGVMPGLRRISNNPYQCEAFLIPIEEVMMTERLMPKEFIHPNGHYVTEEFIEWLRPLVDDEEINYADFKTPVKF